MNFDKPKVFVDLDEYLSLKTMASAINSDEHVLAAKTIIADIFNYKSNFPAIMDALKIKGISFSITDINRRTKSTLDPDDITIVITKAPEKTGALIK